MLTRSETPDSALLFVYGTLRPNARNEYAAYLRRQSTFVGRGQLPGRLYRIDWFPGAVYDSAAPTVVIGDILQLDQPTELLAHVDEYEDVTPDGTGIFVRRLVPVQTANGALTVWTYLYNQPTDNLPIIPNGDFTPYL